MTTWKDKISQEVKDLIDLDRFADSYLSLIHKLLNSGYPESFAIKTATKKTGDLLEKKGVRNDDAVHLLHSCVMVIYPQAYKGCGCHSKINLRGKK